MPKPIPFLVKLYPDQLQTLEAEKRASGSHISVLIRNAIDEAYPPKRDRWDEEKKKTA